MTAVDTVTLFVKNAGLAAAGTHQVDEREKLPETIAALVTEGAAVFCPMASEIEKAAAAGITRLTTDYQAAQVTVEVVSAAIAENGSIVCSSTAGKSVQASLLPAHHIAIVPQDRIFATLDDFFTAYAASPPTNLTLITGPSRTADIELNLVIGVHGPERLDIVVIEGRPFAS
jgi:L-lactate dehydrogenase complex protein LldG